MIEIRGLKKSYGSFTLDIPELIIEDGARVALTGHNGSGKSTLLRLIAGVIKPDEGEIIFSFDRKSIGYMPQNPYAFRGSVESNVKLGAGDGADVKNVLADCFLTELKKKNSAALSGGQRQRMCFARLMAGEHKLLLLDEPFSAADTETAEKLTAYLKKRCVENAAGLVISTHLSSQAAALADRVLVMDEGKIIHRADEDVPPDAGRREKE